MGTIPRDTPLAIRIVGINASPEPRNRELWAKGCCDSMVRAGSFQSVEEVPSRKGDHWLGSHVKTR